MTSSRFGANSCDRQRGRSISQIAESTSRDDSISLWGFVIPKSCLTQEELRYLSQLPIALPALDWVWQEINRVWQQYGLDNRKPLADQPIGDYYSHPVWLMNGVYTAVDEVSASHREAIANHISRLGARQVADYGGGFGELALQIVRASPNADVTVIEPYPTRLAGERVGREKQIRFSPSLADTRYDAIVAQDVLEHVEDPVLIAHQLGAAVRPGGALIFANCFYPVIECHLPSTFHLRYTFVTVMSALGLKYVNRIPGAPHAQVFLRRKRISLIAARRAELVSSIVGPRLNRSLEVAASFRKMLSG